MPVTSSHLQPLSSAAWSAAAEPLVCAHCGDECRGDSVVFGETPFCCAGCEAVHTLLHANGLAAYYACDIPAGTSQQQTAERDPARFDVLDAPSIRGRFVVSDDGRQARAIFSVPALHCASCVWLLERLGRVNDAIGRVEVDMLRRKVDVTFRSDRIAASGVARALSEIGYEPLLTGESTAATSDARRRLYSQLGVAGFAVGNIMLFSIPRYANGAPLEDGFQRLFDGLNIALALPVLVYSAADWFSGAWRALRRRTVSLDIPIAIGLVALFGRSLFDIMSGRGEGYLDSFAGLVFFLLIGRLFQQQTFDWMGFERTYRSFFPLSVRIVSADGGVSYVSIDRVRPGDCLELRPQEVVPADATLLDDHALVDYAFLSGEREPVAVGRGDMVRAGGRIVGRTARLRVIRDMVRSDLAALWDHPAHDKRRPHWLTDVSSRFAAWFVVLALGLAAVGFISWWPDIPRALEVATAVLIIACPCAMTLAAPITLGSAMTMLGRLGWYLKSPAVVLDLSRIDTVMFDKTGTLTEPDVVSVASDGLTPYEMQLVSALAAESVHPISRAIATAVGADVHVGECREVAGAGLRGRVDGHDVVLGSASFVRSIVGGPELHDDVPATHVAIDGVSRGWIRIEARPRPGIEQAIETVAGTRQVGLLSGDGSAEAGRWSGLFTGRMAFGRSPEQKRQDVADLTSHGARVLMVGDGLNDAGAFAAADVGLAVSDNTACIVPACDAVVSGARLSALPRVLDYARAARRIIVICFVVSLGYNAVGLSLALAGHLSPLAAAILMPVSSLTIVALSVGLTRWQAPRVEALA